MSSNDWITNNDDNDEYKWVVSTKKKKDGDYSIKLKTVYLDASPEEEIDILVQTLFVENVVDDLPVVIGRIINHVLSTASRP